MILGFVIGLFVGCSTITENPVAHATVAAPAHYKVELENEYVKVVRVTYGPREKSPIHSHAKGVGVHLTDAKGKFTLPNGDSTVIEAKAGGIGVEPGGAQIVETMPNLTWNTIVGEYKKRYPSRIQALRY